MKLYENIKRLRKEKGLTQDELAKMVGYTDRSSIAKIERGTVDIPQSKIKQFADIFGISQSALMGWEEADTTTENSSGISKAKRELLDLVESCSDEEVSRLLQMMELFLGRK